MRMGRILGWFAAASLPFFGCNCGRQGPAGVPVAAAVPVRGAPIAGAPAAAAPAPAAAPAASRRSRGGLDTPEEDAVLAGPTLVARPAPAAAAAPAAPAEAKGPEAGKAPVSAATLDLTLADISYFDCSDENPKIPDKVLGWSGRRIAIKGFMMPIDYDEGVVHEFMLVPYVPGCCCFGIPFKRNEIVKVKVADAEGCKYLSGALRVEGTLTVHRVSVRDDFIFTMAGAAVHGTE